MTKTETVSAVICDIEAEGLRLTGNINRNVDRIVGTNLLAWERRLQQAYCHLEEDYDIHTGLDGDRYQLLTGRELIAGLADDAMQDEQLKDSYAFVGGIVPNRKYKAYLDDNAGALSGEWEEV
ncbi:hypothetical protein [Lacticaseibacillus sp. 53-4]|uniref:hypothetical protein n=1 Tax=Lacticaseibacillus sp. 53-4 TaxID=2799575 RepID=UPI0019420D95|nr:hypothetical protein [Lacticaseibacillus sp. 53-4]